jgi:hypothetical protein
MVGAEGRIAVSPNDFDTEKEARSHIAKNKGRLGNARRAKVLTVDADAWLPDAKEGDNA